MVRSFRRGALAAVLVLSLAPLAAACAAGDDAQTLQIQPDNSSTHTGDVKVQNAYVLTDPNGPANVTARLFNNTSTDQTLQSVQLAGGITATLSGADGSGSVVVPANSSVLLGGQGNPAAVITAGDESLRDGDVQQAVFTFSGAGPVSLPVMVSPAVGYLQPYGPSSVPTTAAPTTAAPTTSAPAQPGSSATPTNGATPGSGATPTGSATATP